MSDVLYVYMHATCSDSPKRMVYGDWRTLFVLAKMSKHTKEKETFPNLSMSEPEVQDGLTWPNRTQVCHCVSMAFIDLPLTDDSLVGMPWMLNWF